MNNPEHEKRIRTANALDAIKPWTPPPLPSRPNAEYLRWKAQSRSPLMAKIRKLKNNLQQGLA